MPSTYRLDVSGPTSSRIRRLATGGERSAPGCGTTITTGRTPACTMNRPCHDSRVLRDEQPVLTSTARAGKFEISARMTRDGKANDQGNVPRVLCRARIAGLSDERFIGDGRLGCRSERSSSEARSCRADPNGPCCHDSRGLGNPGAPAFRARCPAPSDDFEHPCNDRLRLPR